MVIIINMSSVFLNFVLLGLIARLVTKMIECKNKMINIHLKDFIFYKSWLKKQGSKSRNIDLMNFGNSLFALKIFAIGYILCLVTFVITTFLVFYSGINMKNSPFEIIDFFVMFMFVIEPVSRFLGKEINRRVSNFIVFMIQYFDKYAVLHFITITTFVMTVSVSKIFISSLFGKKLNMDISLFNWLFSLLLYQFFVRRILEYILSKFKYLSIYLTSFKIKVQTYIYLTLIYFIYKLLVFNGVKELENFFAIPIEAIVIFFMIDVYIDKMKG